MHAHYAGGLVVSAVLLLACSSDVHISAATGAGTAAAGGASSNGASGGAVSMGTGGNGGAGNAGGPICPAPDCTDGAINCDPSCGAVHPGCASCTLANDAQVITLPFELIELRLPPIADQLPECAQCRGPSAPWWDMRIKLPLGANCFHLDGPDALRSAVFVSNDGTEMPSLCSEALDAVPDQCPSICVEDLPPDSALWLVLRIEQDTPSVVPDGGALVRIFVQPDASMRCIGGCNGDGDSPTM